MQPKSAGYVFVDPTQFSQSQLPILIVKEDRQGMLGWLIRWHSKGNYNHAEIMVSLGKVASQDPCGYREIPIEKCLDSRVFLKFWQFDPVDRREIGIIIEQVNRDLKKPWWQRRYDFLGLIGQRTGLRWIQSPFGKYCSESVAANLRLIPRLREIIPARPNPAELNTIFTKMPDMKLLGYYWTD